MAQPKPTTEPPDLSKFKGDKLVYIKDVPKLLPGKPALNTIRSWRTNGVSGILLRCKYYGSACFTKISWLQEFLDAVNRRRNRTDSAAKHFEKRKARHKALVDKTRRAIILFLATQDKPVGGRDIMMGARTASSAFIEAIECAEVEQIQRTNPKTKMPMRPYYVLNDKGRELAAKYQSEIKPTAEPSADACTWPANTD